MKNASKILSILKAISRPATIAGLYVMLFAFPFQTFAYQSIFTSSTAVLSTSVSNFISFNGATPASTATNNSFSTMPVGGTMDHLYVNLNAAPAGVTSRTFTVEDAGSATSLTCTITGAATSCSDVTHSFTYAAGDRIILDMTLTGSPVAAIVTAGVRLNPTTTGDVVFLSRQTASLATAGTDYTTLVTNAYIPTEGSTTDPMAVAGVFDTLRYVSASTVGGATTIIPKLRVNFTDTALTCTIAGGGAGGIGCTDNTHTVSVAAGDMTDFSTTVSGSTLATTHSLNERFVPTNSSITTVLQSDSSGTIEVGTKRYYVVSGSRSMVAIANEAQVQMPAPTAMTITNFYATSTAPLGVQTKTYDIRVNGVSSAASCVITGAAQNCAWSGTLTINEGDLIDIESNPTGTASFGYPSFSIAASSPTPVPAASLFSNSWFFGNSWFNGGNFSFY